jgi:hypothetical protein
VTSEEVAAFLTRLASDAPLAERLSGQVHGNDVREVETVVALARQVMRHECALVMAGTAVQATFLRQVDVYLAGARANKAWSTRHPDTSYSLPFSPCRRVLQQMPCTRPSCRLRTCSLTPEVLGQGSQGASTMPPPL